MMRSFPRMRQIPLEDRAEFNLMFLLEHYFPKISTVKDRKDAIRRRIAEHVRRGGKGRVIGVERVKQLSREEFKRRYLSRGVPVVLEGGALGWPLMQRWSFERFKERYGKEIIKLVQRKGISDDDFIDGREFSEEMVFGDFLDQALTGGTKYMRFSPLLEKFPELLDDFDREFFSRMTGNAWGTTFQLFIGGPRTFTPLHNAMTPFFFANVCGIKRWALIPPHYTAVLNPAADGFGYNHSGAEVDAPDEGGFPGFDSIDRMEAVLGPGDLLYLPSWMWHCVQNDSPTIGVRCGFVDPLGMLSESFTLSFIRLFAARNPSTFEALYYSFFNTNLPERDRWLLTPKVYRR